MAVRNIHEILVQKEDMDDLYSQLEAHIITPPLSKDSAENKNSSKSDGIMKGHSPSSSMSTSTNSSMSSRCITPSPTSSDCSCHRDQYILSTDSAQCHLCNQPIPVLQSCHDMITQCKHTIEDLDRQLAEKKAMYEHDHTQLVYLEQTLEQEKQKLKVRIQSIESLKEDMKTVEHKHQEEKAHALAIEQSKKVAERELHELGRRLFEEVDDMISIEKEQKQKIQTTVDRVRQELESTHTELDRVQSELTQLREQMSHHSSEERRPQLKEYVFQDNYTLRAQFDLSTLLSQQPSLISTQHDSLLLDEFREFTHTVDTVPLRRLSTLPFMKVCLQADIEPCLRFGPQPRMTARKIIDTILAKSCFLEPSEPSYFLQKMQQQTPKTRLWDRFTTPAPDTLCCQACGTLVEDSPVWKFRVSYFDEWSCIDRYCRDRIVSVMEFYTFLRRLRVGVYKERSLVDVYEECSRLRLQMAISRMGALPWLINGFKLDSVQLGTASSGA